MIVDCLQILLMNTCRLYSVSLYDMGFDLTGIDLTETMYDKIGQNLAVGIVTIM